MAIRQKDANRFRKTYPFSRTSPQIKYEVDNESELGANFFPNVTEQLWPEIYEATAIEVPDSWVLLDPNGFDVTAILLTSSGLNASFTPAFLSGKWTLFALNDEGEVIHYDEIQLGDVQGFMDFPDWDSPIWTHRSTNGVVSATPGGNLLTLAPVAFATPDTGDWFSFAIDFPPIMTTIVIETQLTISGDDHTGLFWGGIAADSDGIGAISMGGGIEQSSAGLQRGTFFRTNSVSFQNVPIATIKWCRSQWALAELPNASGISHVFTNDDGSYVNIGQAKSGGFGMHITRYIGLWVARATDDLSPYNVTVKMRLKVT
jgi:hypothetical protein